MNRFDAHYRKRKSQANLAEKISMQLSQLNSMTDDQLRIYNITKEEQSTDIEIMKGITFTDTYRFACEHSKKTQENLLSEKINDVGQTLLYSLSIVENLISTRQMTKPQYDCFKLVVDKMTSGNYANYDSIKTLK